MDQRLRMICHGLAMQGYGIDDILVKVAKDCSILLLRQDVKDIVMRAKEIAKAKGK